MLPFFVFGAKKMRLSDDLLQRIKKDFDQSGIDPLEWNVYLQGYVAGIKRFGGHGGNVQQKQEAN